MINIQSFAKAKDGTSYKATSSGFSNSKNVTASLDTHNIWGQPFNGTEDISGNLQNVGSITASGNIQTEGDIIIRQLDEENQVVNDGDLTISVKDKAATFSGKDKYTFDGAIEGTDIKANDNLDVTGASTMNGVTANGDAAFNKNIEVKGQSKLNDVFSNNITNSDTIKTKNLEVTGSAHFFELIIDKIKAAGGAVLFTPANGFKVDRIASVTDGYKLYWQADDGNGNQADNMWKVNDQALCMSFNQAKEGTSHNVANKYYWCLVTAVSNSNQPVTIEEKKYHYIVISTITKDGTVNPEIGDTIAMLGYRGTDDKKRQSAIYISAYTSLDKGLTAPLLAQYQGINDFNLESHRKSYFDAIGSKFVGNFEVSTGQTIEDYINNKIDGAESGTPYIGDNGNWFIWDSDQKAYKDSGVKAEGKDGNNGDNGDNGKDAEFYKLQPLAEQAVVNKDGTLGISLLYNIKHIKGVDEFDVYANTSGYYVRFKPNTYSNYINLSVDTKAPSYINANFQTNYHKQSKKIEYLIVELVSSNIVKDTKTISVQFAASASLEITDSIKTTVQNNTSNISNLAGIVQTNTNNITKVTQKANSIESTVSSHSTNINSLTDKVESNTKNISSITQKANSIESTVSTINNIIDQTSQERRNLISGSYIRRATKKYGGRRLTAQVVKGKKYTFSFNGYCTQELLNKGMWLEGFIYDAGWKIQTEYGRIKAAVPTTVSTTFTAKYTGEMCIDFYPYKFNLTADERNSNTAYIVVNWCQLEEGEVATPWTLAEGEPDINPNLITTDINDLLVNVEDDTKEASVINEGCTLPDGSVYDCIHAKYTGTDLFDAIRFTSGIYLTSRQSYTLSFYAKGSGTISSHLYPSAVMGWIKPDGTLELDQGSANSSTDGNTTINLTNEWTKYVITWTAFCTGGNKKSLLVARLAPNADAYIAGVKLENGGRATAFQRYTDNSISKIVQTAGNIKAEVYDELNKSTGIDIKSGSITLNADNTTIKGNLNITDTNQGMILYDIYGNPKICVQNDSIGSLDSFDFGIDTYKKTQIQTEVNSLNYSFSLPSILLGTFKKGDKLNVYNIKVETRNNQHPFDTVITDFNYKYIIKCGTTVVATIEGTAKQNNLEFNINDYTNNSLSVEGDYILNMQCQVTLKDSSMYGTFINQMSFYVRKVQTSLNKISTDGAVFASSTDKYSWFGSDKTQITNKGATFRISDNVIQRNILNNNDPDRASTIFGDISSTVPYIINNSLNYYATMNDALIIFSTVLNDNSRRNLYLPIPTNCQGKVYYIKNIQVNNTRIMVNGEGKWFMDKSSNGVLEYIDIGDDAAMFISCGFYWLRFI